LNAVLDRRRVSVMTKLDRFQAFCIDQPERGLEGKEQLDWGGEGQKPFWFAANVVCQHQYVDRRARLDAAVKALSLTELKASPAGSIRPFCEAATTTSMVSSAMTGGTRGRSRAAGVSTKV
jgi:hypothetical protein